jgi:hypothetical protein
MHTILESDSVYQTHSTLLVEFTEWSADPVTVPPLDGVGRRKKSAYQALRRPYRGGNSRRPKS